MGKDDISIVSTTDTPEDVQAALTGEPAKPAEVTPAGDKPAAETTPAADAKPADGTPAAAETTEQRDARLENERKSSRERRQAKIQSEIDKLTAQKHQTAREKEQAEREVAELQQRKAQLQAEIDAASGTKPAATPPPDAVDVSKDPTVRAAAAVVASLGDEPKLDDVDAKGQPKFANYEEFVSAVGKWNRAMASAESKLATAEAVARTKQELTSAERARIERDSATRAHDEVLAKYDAQTEEFRKVTPDFDAVLDGAAEFVEELREQHGADVMATVDGYTTQDAEHGVAINYYLAQHPEELRQIVALPPRRQIAALARLDERVGSASKAPARTPAAPVTQAPEPMKPVGGSPTPSTVSPEDEDFRSYANRRNKEERERLAAMSR